jgi:hypothetical protein
MKTENKATDSKVQEYLELLEEIRSKVDDQMVAVELLREVAKDRRMEQIKAERKGLIEVSHDDNGNGQPATLKQKEYLLDLGVKIPQKLSKQKASELLEEALAQRA